MIYGQLGAKLLFVTSSISTGISKRNVQYYDVVVIGGGIIGTAIAKSVKERISSAKVALLEKESALSQHQSSHNSSVIHAGIYYKPDSLKAKLCVEGVELIRKYCELKNIPINKCGKLIIARNSLEQIRLRILYKRSRDNKVPNVALLKNPDEIHKIQPNCSALEALWSPGTGNIDWGLVTKNFGEDFTADGGTICYNYQAQRVEESDSTHPHPILIEDSNKTRQIFAKFAVICTGLHSTKFLENPNEKQISFRVNYGILNPKLNHFIRTNIYAMPAIDLPFLGVHFSPTVDGRVLIGPSAIPALKLEGYEMADFDWQYAKNVLSFRGFQLMLLKYFKTSLNQFNEMVCNKARTEELRKYLPMLSVGDVLPGPSAVQTQILHADGEFVDDFLIDMFEGAGIRRRIIHCRFVPSPGATSCLALARMVTQRIVEVPM